MKYFITLVSVLSFFWIQAAEVWREAENADRNNWTDVLAICNSNGKGASNHEVLRIYTTEKPEDGIFLAGYDLNIPERGSYNLWVAISPSNSNWASPVKIRIDGGREINLAEFKWSSPTFGNRYLGWINAGNVELSKGSHTIDFLVDSTPRKDQRFVCFFDGFLLSTNHTIKPQGNYYISSKQKSWSEVMKEYGSFENLWAAVSKKQFFTKTEKIQHFEEYSAENTKVALDKIMSRPLPSRDDKKRIHRIGIHGMEKPFVKVDLNREAYDRAFELLARAGVDSLRTAETCWHRLGESPDKFNFKEIDYQIEMADRYGMNFLFTIGYPSAKYSKANSHLSTFKPEHEGMFREYLRIVFGKYGKYAQYWEYCNEVDAPHVWWKGASIKDYIRDCKIVREELEKAGSKVPLLGISATYSRDSSHDAGGSAGQAFSRKLAELGIGNLVDGYSLHYTWPLRQSGFVDFFRKLTPDSPASKRLINSEEAAYGHPGDIIKCFARDLYLYGLESVYYYIARDWVEMGTVIFSGLFDMDWQPKLRLASIAAAADAMKTRELVSMAVLGNDIEAYFLREPDDRNYAVILWRNGAGEQLSSKFKQNPRIEVIPVEFPAGAVNTASDWKLDNISFDPEKPVFKIGSEPLIVYVNKFPDWKRVSPEEFLNLNQHTVSTTKAMLPGQN